MLWKNIVFFFSLVAVLLSPLQATAMNPSLMSDEDFVFNYTFHFEVKNGVLRPDPTTAFPYDMNIGSITSSDDPNTTDYYAEIWSGKGKLLLRFGFNAPKTITPAEGRSVFDVSAKHFASAKNALFYAKGGKKLFTIDLSGSSFCNENAFCDTNVGEDYRNCPTDCPPPQNKRKRGR